MSGGVIIADPLVNNMTRAGISYISMTNHKFIAIYISPIMMMMMMMMTIVDDDGYDNLLIVIYLSL